MTLNDCVEEYLDHIRHEKKLAASTCLHYQCWLRHFSAWLTDNGYPDPDLSVFATPVLRRYQYSKTKAGARPRTIRSAFHSLRGMGEWLVENKYIDINPCSALTMPKLDAAVRLTVDDQIVEALFGACDRLKKQRTVALYRAVLAVLCHGALRRDEACALQVEDINILDKSVYVRSGKGSKSRRIYICQDGITALREWLAVRETDCRHQYLFALDRNRRMHHTGIASLVETLKATAGMRDNEAIKPHSLRHWCATNLLRNGANIRDVQQFLGHSDLATTARYLHSSEEQLRDISELTALRHSTPPAVPPDLETPRPAGIPRPRNTQYHVRTIKRK